MAGDVRKGLWLSRGLRELWASLSSPFFGAFALGLLILRFVPPGEGNGLGVSESLLLVGFCAVLASVLALAVQRFQWHWDNETLEDRVRNLVDLLGLARSSIILITGSLNHNLYGDERVLQALRNVPPDVSIDLYHEAPLDPQSGRFIDELIRRACLFTEIAPKQISHGAIIDEQHCKIELFGVDDGAEEKHVDYYPADPARARRAIADIATLVRVEQASAA